MKKGEVANLVCKPEYAYGANVEVELISWTQFEDVSKAKDRSLLMSSIEKGDGYGRPAREDKCHIRFGVKRVGAADVEDGFAANPEPLLKEGEQTFQIGEEEVPDFIETCVQEMKKGAVAEFKLSADSHPEFEPGQELHVRIELPSYEAAPTAWSMETEQLFEEAAKRKAQGNDAYKAKKWARALVKYKRSVEFLDTQGKMSDEQKARANADKVLVLGNQAAVYLQENNWPEVLAVCKKVLDIEPNNFKAHLRRARAHLERDEFESATAEADKCLELQPGEKEALRVKADLARRVKEQKAREGRLFAGMFGKLGDLGYPDKPKKEKKKPVEPPKDDSDSD